MGYSIMQKDLQNIVTLALTAEQLEVIAGALEMYCIGLAEQDDPHLKYAVDAQTAILSVIEDKFWVDEDDDYKEDDADCCHQLFIPELQVITSAELPEYCQMEFKTNGHQGGDSGHGGYATLKIQAGSLGAKVLLSGYDDFDIDGGEEIEITMRGDWEISGFAQALIELGKKILEKL